MHSTPQKWLNRHPNYTFSPKQGENIILTTNFPVESYVFKKFSFNSLQKTKALFCQQVHASLGFQCLFNLFLTLAFCLCQKRSSSSWGFFSSFCWLAIEWGEAPDGATWRRMLSGLQVSVINDYFYHKEYRLASSVYLKLNVSPYKPQCCIIGAIELKMRWRI